MKEFETVRLVNKLMRGQPLSDDESASFGDNIEMFRGNAIYHLESMKMIKAINPEASLSELFQTAHSALMSSMVLCLFQSFGKV